eukprot:359591-Chlamydomonas_euryale.AAC.2
MCFAATAAASTRSTCRRATKVWAQAARPTRAALGAGPCRAAARAPSRRAPPARRRCLWGRMCGPQRVWKRGAGAGRAGQRGGAACRCGDAGAGVGMWGRRGTGWAARRRRLQLQGRRGGCENVEKALDGLGSAEAPPSGAKAQGREA